MGALQASMLQKMQLQSSIAASSVTSHRKVEGLDFASMMKNGIGQVDQLQTVAANKVRDVELGLSDDLVGATIANQKAGLSFSALVQVRNKMVSNFDEIMKMAI